MVEVVETIQTMHTWDHMGLFFPLCFVLYEYYHYYIRVREDTSELLDPSQGPYETDRRSRGNIVLNVGGSQFQGRDGMAIIISSISNYYYY